MKYIKILLVSLFFSHCMVAQQTKLFVIYSHTSEHTQILTLNKQANTLVAIGSNVNTNFFDGFIIKPSVEHSNTVYLISAQENDLFLKRNGTNLEFGNIVEEGENKVMYEWEIQYAGFPYVAISEPSNLRNVIYLENDLPIMKEVPNTEWPLEAHDDVKGNNYRFKIENIVNTL